MRMLNLLRLCELCFINNFLECHKKVEMHPFDNVFLKRWIFIFETTLEQTFEIYVKIRVTKNISQKKLNYAYLDYNHAVLIAINCGPLKWIS